MKQLNQAVIVAAKRTPFGSFQSTLADMTAPYLAQVASKAVIKEAGLKPNEIDGCIMGMAIQAGGRSLPA